MKISLDLIKELREQSGAGVMQCRNALEKNEGDREKALAFLKEQGLLKAQEKAERTAAEGLIEAYIHTGGRVGAMLELNCETDFVARTDEFKQLAHNLAMQVAAMAPQFVSEADVPEGADIEPRAACLLRQPYIKDQELTIQDIITETIAKVGENIKVGRFARFELGEQEQEE
ncbi:MAG TPA: translation elongation factor Ts [Dehalococcoidales bacterium]|nr:translation elongation factor Ts [Dehalococcoidales bacterium]